MKHLFDYIVLATAAFTMASCSGDDDDNNSNVGGTTTVEVNTNKNTTTSSAYASNLEFPHLVSSNLLIVHETRAYGMTYALEWNPTLKSQRWSCYQMHAGNAKANTKRWEASEGEEQYPQDPNLPSAYRFGADPFWHTGYNHGHICPSADRLSSSEQNKQTFYLTNMQPQVNGFNAKVWANMESMVRSWNNDSFRDTLFVCKGGTIEATTACEDAVLEKRSTGLIVPKYYFMAVLCKKGGQYKALGFWIEHKACDDKGQTLAKYVVNIEELERLTGIDFFCNLPDEIEKRVESNSVDNIKRAWGFK